MPDLTEQEIARRKKSVQAAIAINAIGGVPLSDYTLQLMDDWTMGKITAEEAEDRIIAHYKNLFNPNTPNPGYNH